METNHHDSSLASSSLQATLTDYYQVTMAYTAWKQDRENLPAVFEVSFRKAPFNGTYAIFAGVEEAVKYINSFRFTNEQISFLKEQLSLADPTFFEFLRALDCSDIRLYSIDEGSVVFPHIPLMRIEGPLALCQLLESPLLNILGYSTLVATNAARYRVVTGWKCKLFEFGLRRAQGPDGAMTASKYSYLGGFDGTSNVRAGQKYKIPLSGTMSHAFITSYCVAGPSDGPDGSALKFKINQKLNVNFEKLEKLAEDGNSGVFVDKQGNLPEVLVNNFHGRVMEKRKKVLGLMETLKLLCDPNETELESFIAFGKTNPTNLLCLLDTYDTLKSGLPNFLSVALALDDLGFSPIGIRLDSGDLSYLSRVCRRVFREISREMVVNFSQLVICASNEINEEILQSLHHEGHEIDTFGIGTHLVTCLSQPSLGLVYKLVEIRGKATMKCSEVREKVTLPGKKDVYRLYVNETPVLDLIQLTSDPPPRSLEKIFCRHLSDDTKRCMVIPHRIETLLRLVWCDSKICCKINNLQESRIKCIKEIKTLRSDHLRGLNPAPYKVSSSQKYFTFYQELYNQTAPISIIS